MKVLKMNFLPLLLLSLYLTSCQDSLTSDLKLSSSTDNIKDILIPGITTENGMIKFEDYSAYKKTVKNLHNYDYEALMIWALKNDVSLFEAKFREAEKEYEFHSKGNQLNSFFNKYDNVVIPNSEWGYKRRVPFSRSHAFLNENGYYMIGDIYYFVSGKEVISILDKNLISQVRFDSPLPKENDNIFISTIKRINSSNQNLDVSLRSQSVDCSKKSNNNNKGSYVLLAEISVVQWITQISVPGVGLVPVVRAEARAEARSKIKRTFGWQGRGAQLDINGTIVATDGASSESISVSASRWGRSLYFDEGLNSDFTILNGFVPSITFDSGTTITTTSDKVPGKSCYWNF